MLARHAESVFWTGRYLERAEGSARLLDVTYHSQLQAMPWEADRAWSDLLKVLGLSAGFAEVNLPPTPSTVSEYVVFSTDNPGSIGASVARARENVRSVREMIPTEFWLALNSFHLDLQGRNLPAEVEAHPHALYDHVKRQCQMVAGVAAETMPRDECWWFLQMGWMLERAEMTCRLLDARYGQLVAAGAGGGTFHHWATTLRSASGSEAFRRIYRGSMDASDVVEFLLLSDSFPRSVFFALRNVESSMRRVPARERPTRPERLIGRARADLEFLDVHELLDSDVHAFLNKLQNEVRQVAEALAVQFFRNSQEFSLHALDMDRVY